MLVLRLRKRGDNRSAESISTGGKPIFLVAEEEILSFDTANEVAA